jgi:hypothetical protein
MLARGEEMMMDYKHKEAYYLLSTYNLTVDKIAKMTGCPVEDVRAMRLEWLTAKKRA